MPQKKIMELRVQLDRERAEKLSCLELFRTLTDAMKAYQNGTGPEPLARDFENWKQQTAETLQHRCVAAPYVV